MSKRRYILRVQTRQKLTKALVFIVGLAFCLVGSAILGLVVINSKTQDAVVGEKTNISMSVKNKVNYHDNSFFGSSPDKDDKAYVTSLTNSIDSDWTINYSSGLGRNLSYKYQVIATIKGVYSVEGSGESSSTVWKEDHQLIKPESRRVNDKAFSVDIKTTIPFRDYKAQADKFRTSLSLPVETFLEAKLMVDVRDLDNPSGFNESREAKLIIPLNKQVYGITTNYPSSGQGDSTSDAPTNNKRQDFFTVVLSLALVVLGVGMMIHSSKQRVYRTEYQSRLNKILRYHRDVIVKSTRPTNLGDKDIIPVQSFDDLLNLHEELSIPIIARTISSSLTQFIVIHEDVVYVYNLGESSSSGKFESG